jgi:hypothetical protein
VRKRIVTSVPKTAEHSDNAWLKLEELADVEITSEDVAHPIESALLPGTSSGWRAAAPGKQTIWLFFYEPQPLQRIWLNFVEPVAERTQEYTLRWSPDNGKSYREIVRQQWNFTPEGAPVEIEDHRVDLPAVTVLELTIIPDTSNRSAFASLELLRLA